MDPIPASNHSTSPPVVRPDSSVRRTARIVGVLFLAGYLTYGVGNLIATGIVDSGDRSDSTALFVTGIALMLLNSAFVIGIGVLMFPILRAHNKAIAAGYLGTRIFEGVVLAIGVVSLIVLTSSDAIDANAAFYNVAEAGLGIGSLFFCALLFRTGLVPRWLAAWGFIGYACFAAGNLLELFGVAGAALVAAIPGGLFELTFAIWLIARGFASTATVRSPRKHLTDVSAPPAIRSVWTTRNNMPGAFGLRNASRSVALQAVHRARPLNRHERAFCDRGRHHAAPRPLRPTGPGLR